MKTRNIVFSMAVVGTVGMAMIVSSGCPPDTSNTKEVMLKSLLAGCQGCRSAPEYFLLEVLDTDTHAAIVFAGLREEDTDGQLSVLAEKHSDGSISRVIGGSYAHTDGECITWWYGNNGYPQWAVIDGALLYFTNYTDTTVDVAVIDSDSQRYIFDSLEVDLPFKGKERESNGYPIHLITVDTDLVDRDMHAVTHGKSRGPGTMLKDAKYWGTGVGCAASAVAGIFKPPVLIAAKFLCKSFAVSSAARAIDDMLHEPGVGNIAMCTATQGEIGCVGFLEDTGAKIIDTIYSNSRQNYYEAINVVERLYEPIEEANYYNIDICDQWVSESSGGYGITTDSWDISTLPSGTEFDIYFDTYSIPDKIVIQYPSGTVVLDTGWRGSTSRYNPPELYPGGIVGPGMGTMEGIFTKTHADSFTVIVYGPERGTVWEYSIKARCP